MGEHQNSDLDANHSFWRRTHLRLLVVPVVHMRVTSVDQCASLARVLAVTTGSLGPSRISSGSQLTSQEVYQAGKISAAFRSDTTFRDIGHQRTRTSPPVARRPRPKTMSQGTTRTCGRTCANGSFTYRCMCSHPAHRRLSPCSGSSSCRGRVRASSAVTRRWYC